MTAAHDSRLRSRAPSDPRHLEGENARWKSFVEFVAAYSTMNPDTWDARWPAWSLRVEEVSLADAAEVFSSIANEIIRLPLPPPPESPDREGA